MLLEIKNLWVRYDLVEALRGLSITLDQGEIVTMLGANGAGKSTTLKTISGLKTPASGEVWFEGKRIDGLPPHAIVKQGIAHVPEGRRIFPEMTVMDNLLLGTHLRWDSKRIKEDLEDIFGHFPILRERRNQQGGSLSGGEQQMLAMARALMSSPKVMLMDEPTLGLSPLMVREIRRITGAINKNGVGIILVEQNARMALSTAHRGYVLVTGRIVLEGDSQQLKNDEQVKKYYLGGKA
jgi:branched-chain amino acid transport system ATP-binding protein